MTTSVSILRRLDEKRRAHARRWARRFRGPGRPLARRLAFDALRFVTPSVAVDKDGLRLYVSTSDRVVGRETFAEGAYERKMFARVMAELRRAGLADLEGRGFLDAGANIGSATCLALRHYGAAEAWSFEPAPENVRLLHQNVLVNGFQDRAHVQAVALSDHAGVVAFELSDKGWGDHRVRVAGASNGANPALYGEMQRPTIDVPARRLDDLVAEGAVDLGSLGLAWIDVQGHEGHVLAGAGGLLATDVPIVCEYWPYALERAGGLERFHTLVAGSRSRFIDLTAPDATVLRIERLRAVGAQYEGVKQTDLLLLP